MNKSKNCKDGLLAELKSLLNKNRFSTQLQLAKALGNSGFNDVSQPKVARLIKKVGAIKVRENHKSSFYQIPETPSLNIRKSISTVIRDINHNNKTVGFCSCVAYFNQQFFCLLVSLCAVMVSELCN
jgi:transcriptional regulator of arginine metabolism